MIRLSVLCFALLSGCTIYTTARPTTPVHVQATYVAVASAPPAPHAPVAHGARPTTDAVWVAGHWDWQGDWVWRDGHWVTGRTGYEWEPPLCVAVDGGGYQYHQGYWRRAGTAPPPIYRTPGTIRVHARPANQRPVVERVVIRPGGQRSTVVVQSGRARGDSTTVVVRPRPAPVRPAPPPAATPVRPAPR
ncbi:MAG: hypothetical protein AAF645_28510, partial [Myxococcota bacterium]